MVVEAVTIPAAEYCELLAIKASSTGLQTVAEVPSRGRLENDAEVALFLMHRFGRIRMDQLLQECYERFGWKRTPSRAAAYRYWKKMREKALKTD